MTGADDLPRTFISSTDRVNFNRLSLNKAADFCNFAASAVGNEGRLGMQKALSLDLILLPSIIVELDLLLL